MHLMCSSTDCNTIDIMKFSHHSYALMLRVRVQTWCLHPLLQCIFYSCNILCYLASLSLQCATVHVHTHVFCHSMVSEASNSLSVENNSHMAFVGPEEIVWRNLLHAVTRSKVTCYSDYSSI